MSLFSELNAQLIRFPAMRNFPLPRNIQLSVPQKVTVVSVTVGLALLGFLARYFRRKRHVVGSPPEGEMSSGYIRGSARRKGRDSRRASGGRGSAYKGRSPNGDTVRRSLHRQASSSVSAVSVASSTAASGVSSALASGLAVDAAAALTPQQLGVMGMEALQTAISYWEDALESYGSRGTALAGSAGDPQATSRPLAVTTAEEAEFSRELHNLLDAAYKLQDDCELLFLDQRSVLFREDTSAVREWVAGSGKEGSRRGHLSRSDSDRRTNITGASSSPDSFASAQDEVADLREFEAFTEIFPDYENLPLYQTALKQLENGGVPYRCLRTEAVNCVSNVEYLGKLYCIRLAFQYLFRQPSTWVWFADTGQQILMDLLLFADKDPKDFLIAYEDMLSFLQSLGARDGSQTDMGLSSDIGEKAQYPNACTWTDVEEELATRGVKAMTFFDVVLDYILLDAFEDLEEPPSSVTAVVQNRWLSSGFKETALATAVWSLLKAKRHRLTQPNGFMAHFYAISEHISPLMAWGFLGTDDELRTICLFFKEQVMGFLQDIFSFQQTRYTSVEELAVDVMGHARSRADFIMQRLSAPIEPPPMEPEQPPSPQLLDELGARANVNIPDGKI